VRRPYQALEDIIELGCERILTSGGKSTAMEGATVLAHLVEKAAGRIAIMPGSGVNRKQRGRPGTLYRRTEVHSSARVKIAGGMQYQNDHILLNDGLTDEYSLDVTSTDRVKEILKRANE
jgi:copper homeostasis protein